MLSFFSLTVVVLSSVAHIFILVIWVCISFKIKIEAILWWWGTVDRIKIFSGRWLQIELIWHIFTLKIKLSLPQWGLIDNFALKCILLIFLRLGFFILVFLPFMLVLDLPLNISNFLIRKFLVITWNTFWVYVLLIKIFDVLIILTKTLVSLFFIFIMK